MTKRPRPGPRDKGAREEAELPERYEVIAEANLFRHLGWEEARHNPFGLVGIVQRPNGPRALITRQGRPAGLYAEVGADVGDGYTVASIGRRSVKLIGGALGEVTLALDASIAGSRGGGHDQQARSEESAPDAVGDGRWRPVRGLSKEEVVNTILGREGFTLEEVLSNKELETRLEKKYGYLEDEGYIQDDDDDDE